MHLPWQFLTKIQDDYVSIEEFDKLYDDYEKLKEKYKKLQEELEKVKAELSEEIKKRESAPHLFFSFFFLTSMLPSRS